jgi:imidazolonepropionase-like amidohydrolase
VLTLTLLSTLVSAHAADVALVGGTVLPVAGPAIGGGTVLLRDGKITAVGAADTVRVPAGARVIDCVGRFVTPGIIDTHSHMGVYPWTIARGNGDGNEATAPATPQVRAEDGIYLDDPAFARARAGGVTTVLVIPGSANLVGGEGVVLKLRPSGRLEELRFGGAPRHVKMAMGENPKRVYGNKGRTPSTRMGNLAYLRERFAQAKVYRDRWEEWRETEGDRSIESGLAWPGVDHELERLADIIEGKLRVQVHCYTTSDIQALLRLSDEVGFRVAAIHHALEAYKVRDVLAERGVGVCTWADWWGFKQEAWDAIPENVALCAQAGVTVAVHSDSSSGVQRLWHEAAKTVATGATEAQALEAITLGPARILGVEARVGTLEAGKDADIAVFSRHPFDVTTRVELTLIDGEVVYDRAEADAAARADIAARTRRPAAPTRSVVIRGGRVLPVSGAPIEGGVVEMRGGRIVSVGGPGTPVAPDAEVIDARGQTVFPGLIDAACHVGLVEVQSDPSHREAGATGGLFVPHVRVTDGLNPDSETIRVARAAGVTTCIITPEESNPMAGLAAAIDLDGRTVSDMVARDAVALCLNLGSHPVGTGRGKGAFGTRMELIAKMREVLLAAESYARKLERFEAERARHDEKVKGYHEELARWETEHAAWEVRAQARAAEAASAARAATATADAGALGPSDEAPKRPDEPGLPPVRPDRKLDMEALLPALTGAVPVMVRAHTDRTHRPRHPPGAGAL